MVNKPHKKNQLLNGTNVPSRLASLETSILFEVGLIFVDAHFSKAVATFFRLLKLITLALNYW